MKEKNLQNNLLMALGNHKPLVMDLGDNVLLHMKWEENTITPDGIKGCYVYACNSNMQKYLKEFISSANEVTLNN